jgi:hypothetical protein
VSSFVLNLQENSTPKLKIIIIIIKLKNDEISYSFVTFKSLSLLINSAKRKDAVFIVLEEMFMRTEEKIACV